MIHLGSIYLIVNDFDKSISFYEQLLGIKVTSKNMERFAQFIFEGKNISIMNGHFDAKNPEKTIRKGEYTCEFDDLVYIANAENTRKFVLNFWTESLDKERERIKELDITDKITNIKYVRNVAPYYYFQLTDPDGNVIEITGNYTPGDNEFDE